MAVSAPFTRFPTASLIAEEFVVDEDEDPVAAKDDIVAVK
jgi:hypothetical protein